MAAARESIDPSTVLHKYLPRDLTRSVLARIPLVTMVLDVVGRGRWTIRIERGEVSLDVGAIKHPTCSIRTDAATLADMLLGHRSGVEAFLAGDLVARGSLATVLQIGGAFAPEADLPTRAHSREVSALGVRTAYLEAGPSRRAPRGAVARARRNKRLDAAGARRPGQGSPRHLAGHAGVRGL